MKLSSSSHTWAPPQPTPFRFQLQVCTNDQEAERVRDGLFGLLYSAGVLADDKTLKKVHHKNDAARLVHWLALNLDQANKPETEL